MSPIAADHHAQLMDGVYRGQRHIYDLTRKYYLFGRDRLIADLDCPNGGTLLEIACGTGRNLAQITRKWPGIQAHGMDISREMLKSARRKLGMRARLAQGDACHFAPSAEFGHPHFDRVVLSYSLSMIPDWQLALAHATTLVAPGGALHIVDFGDLSGLAAPLRDGLNRWLAKFHVAPRIHLPQSCTAIARHENMVMRAYSGPFSYYTRIILERPHN